MVRPGSDSQMPPISGPGAEEDAGWSGATPQLEGYEVTGHLGQGGMGTVWRAVQLSTQRQVALKLLARGAFAAEKALARFEREVELTARLQHPNIAQIFDSGLHQGVRYYAMELVDGTALDDYVKGQRLPQRQILELMRTVCEAVQHAHERGVIHRDLKPSNILVTADGQPHVLDFGLAKGLLERDSVLGISTDGGAGGTPAYMSPEQAAGHVEQIDTRTDVYSLGVILFQLLTKELPHGLSGTRYEVLRRIAEEEVKRPREVTKSVDRELEALLLKALSHDPKGRYSYAGAMAQDIENYLTGEPLSARPPTTAYFLRKRIRKYRVPVAIACLVLASLIGMAVFAYLRVAQERTKAIAAEKLARGRLVETERARDSLQKEADKAKAVLGFLRNTIITPHPWGRGTSSPQALDRAVRDVGSEFANRPEIEAAVRMETGNVFVLLNQLDAAEMQFSRALEIRRRALGEHHPDTLGAMEILAVTRWHTGNLDGAEAIHRQILEVRRRVLGEEHTDTLKSMSDLRVTLLKRGKFGEVEKLDRERLEICRRVLGEEHRETLGSTTRLAAVFEERGKLDEAEALRRELLEIQRRIRGEKHLDTLKAINRLAVTLWRGGKLDEAEAMNRRSLEIRQGVHGDEHPDTLWAMDNLAFVIEEGGKTNEAEALRNKEFEIWRRVLGTERARRQPGSSPTESLSGPAPAADKPAAKAEVNADTVAKGRGEGNVLAYDGFGGELSLGWKILNPDPSHSSLTKDPGALTITTQEGAFCGTNTDYENLFLTDCPSAAGKDFQLTTCLSSFKPVAHWNQAGLICYNDDDNYLKFVFQWSTMSDAPVFTVGIETEGRFSFVHFLAHPELERLWLRVTKRGNRFTFSTSLDGKTFLATRYPEHDSTGLFQRGVVWGDGSVRRVGLFAKNGTDITAPEIDASFDFFEVRSLSNKAELVEKGFFAHEKKTNVETR